MSKKHTPKVFVAPLDWGLGHTTRCIPIINYLIRNHCTVIIGSEGKAYTLLKAEFPEVECIHLKGYRVLYSNSKRLLPFKILCQLPKIIRSIYKEHRWLKKIIEEHHIDAVISDNRFGLHNKNIPCVFITHQLGIKGPYNWIERMMQHVNYKHINNFSACWIPDFEGEPNLAGGLSHPVTLPTTPIRYLGALSRLQSISSIQRKYDVLIILSGPEPQRSIAEQQLLPMAATHKSPVLFVRGLPGSTNIPEVPAHIRIENHLSSGDLSIAFQQSDYIVSRAGYTTIMDIVKLKKKSIVIPTPGQTEQEYLGHHLQQQQLCVCMQQHDFNLQQALQTAASFPYKMPLYPMDLYQPVIGDWIQMLKNKLALQDV